MKHSKKKLLIIACISLCSLFVHAETGQPQSDSQTADQIRANIRSMPYDDQSQAKLKRFGIVATHHILLTLVDTKTNRQLTDARVTAWIEDRDGLPRTAKVKLISTRMARMAGYSGDINLSSKKDAHIVIEAALRDGSKRIFHF